MACIKVEQPEVFEVCYGGPIGALCHLTFSVTVPLTGQFSRPADYGLDHPGKVDVLQPPCRFVGDEDEDESD